MPAFQIGTTIETTEPAIDVTVTAAAPIPPGTHVFQLVVVDDAGNQSDPDKEKVVIRDTVKPTAVLAIEPTQVQPGQSFRLNGTRSSDVPPGKIVKYIWTMVE